MILYFSFITAQKAVGAKGFKASWTEISESSSSCDAKQFRCASNKHCIPLELKCNNINNCGKNDNSDELNCKFVKIDN